MNFHTQGNLIIREKCDMIIKMNVEGRYNKKTYM